MKSLSKTKIKIQIKGNVTLFLPDSIEVFATYLLLEQEDSFEKEASFIRSCLTSGMKMLDRDPGYGIYAIPAAK